MFTVTTRIRRVADFVPSLQFATVPSRRVEAVMLSQQTVQTNMRSLQPIVPTKLLSFVICGSQPVVTTIMSPFHRTHLLSVFGRCTADVCTPYRCCLQSRVPGPAACLCEIQQSASASCFLNGLCSPSTCQTDTQTCTGTFSTAPLSVCSVAGALTCTGTGSSEVDLTWLVFRCPFS